MKILMISSFLPYPLYSGGHVRLYNIIKELSKSNEITLICEKRDNQAAADISEIEKMCKKVIIIQRRKQWSVQNILKTAVSQSSFLITGHTEKRMRDEIERAIKNQKFDLIHVETFYVMQNLPNASLPIVLTEHNIEHQVYERFVNSMSIPVRWLLKLDIAKIKKDEETYWRKATKLVTVSKEDGKIMQETGVFPVVVANAVDTKKFSLKDSKKAVMEDEKRILFIGDFKWIQNIDTCAWIIKEIWPQIKTFAVKEKLPSMPKLWIVARKIPENIRKLTQDKDVLFDEESSTLMTEKIFQRANILLSPIRVGGGTSYKILESMSCGTPVVTYSMSAESIEAVDMHDILIGDNPSDTAQKAVQLLMDPILYEKISKNGRKLIENKYTWGKIVKDLEDVYKSAI